MAIDVCSEISIINISPRISFSHDLNQDSVSIKDCNPRLDSSLLDSDFNFCFGSSSSSFVQELSSADELFSNGKILPTQIKKHKKVSISTQDNIDQPRLVTTTEKKLLKEFLSMSIDADDQKPVNSKSFWQFKRSNSLNCDSKGLIRSLQFLSRSNSTGSAPNPQKLSQKPSLQKQHSVPSRKPPATSFGALYGYNTAGQKHPSLRKCGSYGNGVRISPVLNIPPPYISSGTVNLFGLGSLFCNGKVKRKKR